MADGANSAAFSDVVSALLHGQASSGSNSNYTPGGGGDSTIPSTSDTKQKPSAKKRRKKQPRNPYISLKKQRELQKKRHERTLRKGDSANYPLGHPTRRSAKILTDDNTFEEGLGALVADETQVPSNLHDRLPKIDSPVDSLLAVMEPSENQDDWTEDQMDVQSTTKERATTPPFGDSFAQSLVVQPPIQDEIETETAFNAVPSLQYPAESIDEVFKRPSSGQNTIEVSEAEIDEGQYTLTRQRPQSLPCNWRINIQETNTEQGGLEIVVSFSA